MNNKDIPIGLYFLNSDGSRTEIPKYYIEKCILIFMNREGDRYRCVFNPKTDKFERKIETIPIKEQVKSPS